MKITRKELDSIIQEELSGVLEEAKGFPGQYTGSRVGSQPTASRLTFGSQVDPPFKPGPHLSPESAETVTFGSPVEPPAVQGPYWGADTVANIAGLGSEAGLGADWESGGEPWLDAHKPSVGSGEPDIEDVEVEKPPPGGHTTGPGSVYTPKGPAGSKLTGTKSVAMGKAAGVKQQLPTHLRKEGLKAMIKEELKNLLESKK